MTDRARTDDPEPDPADFDWASPRWREAEPTAPGAERGRRFRDATAPRQRGAIDAGGSVPSAAEHGSVPDEEPTEA